MKRQNHPLVETASEYVGFTARQTANVFLQHAGVAGSNFQWDGSFVDLVAKKTYQGAALKLPSHNNTTAALSFYIRNGWQRRAPKPGDIVFFSHPTADVGATAYLAPHIGIVSATGTWSKHRTFRVIEAQTWSGLPKAPRENNGVYERTHHQTDVVAFVRIPQTVMKLKAQPQKLISSTSHIVRRAHLERCTSSQKASTARPEYRKSTELVQLALAEHPAARLNNADRYVFNGKVQAALAAFQRFIGLPSEDCNGLPDERTLEALAASPYTTNKFDVDS